MSVTLTHLRVHLLFSFKSLFIRGKSIEHALVKQRHASRSHCRDIHTWEMPVIRRLLVGQWLALEYIKVIEESKSFAIITSNFPARQIKLMDVLPATKPLGFHHKMHNVFLRARSLYGSMTHWLCGWSGGCRVNECHHVDLNFASGHGELLSEHVSSTSHFCRAQFAESHHCRGDVCQAGSLCGTRRHDILYRMLKIP